MGSLGRNLFGSLNKDLMVSSNLLEKGFLFLLFDVSPWSLIDGNLFFISLEVCFEEPIVEPVVTGDVQVGLWEFVAEVTFIPKNDMETQLVYLKNINRISDSHLALECIYQANDALLFSEWLYDSMLMSIEMGLCTGFVSLCKEVLMAKACHLFETCPLRKIVECILVHDPLLGLEMLYILLGDASVAESAPPFVGDSIVDDIENLIQWGFSLTIALGSDGSVLIVLRPQKVMFDWVKSDKGMFNLLTVRDYKVTGRVKAAAKHGALSLFEVHVEVSAKALSLGGQKYTVCVRDDTFWGRVAFILSSEHAKVEFGLVCLMLLKIWRFSDFGVDTLHGQILLKAVGAFRSPVPGNIIVTELLLRAINPDVGSSVLGLRNAEIRYLDVLTIVGNIWQMLHRSDQMCKRGFLFSREIAVRFLDINACYFVVELERLLVGSIWVLFFRGMLELVYSGTTHRK